MMVSPLLAAWQALVEELRQAKAAGRPGRLWFYACDAGVFLIE